MSIHLGFEVGTGKAIEIPLRHTAITGQTQESGKTTTLEGLLTRSKLRGLAYITKRGESSFHVANPIQPYFRERTDWQFVSSILEASVSEKLKFQRAWIMKLCQARHNKAEEWPVPKTLADVRNNVDQALEKARGMNESVYTELREYLNIVVPQIDRLPYSASLELAQGVNVMDLTSYEFPMQALVVRSCIEWIKLHERNTVNVIPEAWKFAPKQRGSPVRLSAEELIREGGALKNFIWLDSQDIAGVADVLLRQIGVWIFGVQRAKHEIERTLDHIPQGLLARRPKPADVATLGKGQFFVCWGQEMYRVYVQPAWMKPAHAEAIARGEEDVESAREILESYAEEHPNAEISRTAVPHERAVARVNGEAVAVSSGPQHGVRVPGLREGVDAAASSAAPDGDPQRGHDSADENGSARVETEKAMNPNINIAASIASIRKSVAAPVSEKDIEKSPHMVGAYMQLRGNLAFLMDQYDQLVLAHDALAKSSATQRAGAGREPQGTGGGSPSFDDNLLDSLPSIYSYVRKCAEDDPGILELLRTRPELHVQVTRQKITITGDTLKGRLAGLIAGKFFDQPKPLDVVRAECLRRAWFGSKTPNQQIIVVLTDLATLGFLTIEPTGYQAVPGMKIHIQEA